MPAALRRSIVTTLAAVAAVVSIASQALASDDASRLRTAGPPAPRYVFGGTDRMVARTTGGITLRPSRIAMTAAERDVDHLSDRSAPSAASSGDRTPLAPVPGTHVEGLSGFERDPADPTGAVGDTRIVMAVNTKLAVYDRTGALLFGPVSLASLIPGVEGQKFDPKIVYDQYEDTFVLVFLVRDAGARRSRVIVTTIPDATADDRSTWCGTDMRGDAFAKNGKQWADYPGLGYDANSVTISTNAFTFGGGYAYAQLYHIADAELFAACVPTDPVTFEPFGGDDTRDPDGSKAFTIQPAQTEGASDVQYLLSYDASGRVVLWRLRETAKGPRLGRSALRVRRVQIAPYGTQKGGSYRDIDTYWDPGDLRFVNAFYDAALNRVYAAHVIFRDLTPDPIVPYAEAAIRWYEVRPTRRLKAATVTRTGIVGKSETDAGWPAVATDSSGNLFVTYNRASKPRGEYLSAWAAEIAPGTKAAVMLRLTPGEARFEANRNDVERWGDFDAINRDPTDGTVVAMVNQYARSDGGRTTQTWQQTLDLVSDG